MKNESYINYNGKLFASDEQIFSINNRAFKYGDALFETIRVVNGKLCFVEDHFKRLKQGVELLKMKSSNISFNDVKVQIEELLVKNNIKEGGRVRLTVFRDAEGFYQPINEKKAYVIEAKSIDNNYFELNVNGLKVDIYSEQKRSTSKLSNIKTTNSLQQILAGIYCKENELDECLMLNKHGRIAEAMSSNVFLYKNNNIYTSSLEEGCIDGVMRKQILKIAAKMNINIFEGMVNGSMLLQADELFLTNAVKGIQWVESFKEKQYTNETIQLLINELNQSV
ncbi:4-amino-4-deoxychorismate lyase [Vicingus serpentipes]|uniref:branched-chain-amino-acid transaminase n=1 Tax=Vicingus serpentipes TaxID=1926625 RepID=A0A5C6RUB2_9FLAO|nr:aminotransferase class IV [Vicingus serpentipes]TXB65891.1 4-amino-4-deoxychorismate lyase [Vicingus serpentipes]